MAITCKTALNTYEQLSIYTLNKQLKLLSSQLTNLATEYEKNKVFPHNYITPEKSQTYANSACEICKNHTDLSNTVTLIINSNDNKPFAKNDNEMHQLILNFNIPHDMFTNILEDAMQNSKINPTEEDNNNLQYLANYLNYPNPVSRIMQPLKNVYVQLLLIFILVAIVGLGLGLYCMRVPSGAGLRNITKVEYPQEQYHYSIGYAITNSCPYVSMLCLRGSGPSSYTDHSLAIFTHFNLINDTWIPFLVCYLDSNNVDSTNISTCINSLKKFSMNLTYWEPIIKNMSTGRDSIVCMSDLDNISTTCGSSYNIGGVYFKFNTVDSVCVKKMWSVGLSMLATFAIFGCTAPLWGLSGYFGGKSYNFITFLIGMVVYLVCVLPIYIVVLIYSKK